ncbi:MAG TPA: UDP-3-O-(3-hydroxymyristoyl)glucosamine N-acyltransferase [Stenotrophobium sp.]|jgi:UDP-3-O-[3-hydroxymyristoyl] glucosamine N-acyltransferase|nr:UDP-3-O-(3-hydroxymyristoyl)glucosamine N-acyltransferase [Stenotrophobium sp.]
MSYTLGEIAQRFGLEIKGDAGTMISGVCGLVPGKPDCITFLNNPKLRGQLAATQAAAVIIGPRDVPAFTGNGLVAPDPYLAYARIAGLFDRSREFTPGVHASAVVAASARIGEGCCIAANAVIEEGVRIGANSYIGPGCIVGRDAQLGEQARLVAQVNIGHDVRIGKRCYCQPGAVIGSRGFGNAMGPKGWEEVPQLGTVVIGDDVEVGANTTIDRGAIDDTVIGDNVRLDNQIQIAHNVQIGAHTAIAACVGIAGSARIGARCMIAGAAVINGHIEIADDIVVMGYAMVTKSLLVKGVYGSGMPADNAREWRKQIARVRRLEHTEARLRKMEQHLGIKFKLLDGDHDSE